MCCCFASLGEVLGWVVVSLLTQTATSYIFAFISTAQIAQWALKKKSALQKEFGRDKTPRYALFPYLL